MQNLRSMVMLALGWVLCVSGSVAQSQAFPNKPIRIIAPMTAGGTTDIMARLISQKLTENTGQPVIVDNRPGANGIIGTVAVAKAAADGYTILLASSGSLTTNINLFKTLPYDPVKDFAPVTQLGSVSYALVVGNNSPVNSVKDLVALAKASPGKRTLASTSSALQLTVELFKLAAGIDMTSVPYKTAPAAFIDLASGELDAFLEPIPSTLPQINAGRLKALAVTSAKRSTFMPNVPTIAESGYPGFESDGWVAFVVPVGTPKEVIAKLHAEVVRVLQTEEAKEKLRQNGFEMIGGTPEQLAEVVRIGIAKWARVIKDAKLTKAD